MTLESDQEFRMRMRAVRKQLEDGRSVLEKVEEWRKNREREAYERRLERNKQVNEMMTEIHNPAVAEKLRTFLLVEAHFEAAVSEVEEKTMKKLQEEARSSATESSKNAEKKLIAQVREVRKFIKDELDINLESVEVKSKSRLPNQTTRNRGATSTLGFQRGIKNTNAIKPIKESVIRASPKKSHSNKTSTESLFYSSTPMKTQNFKTSNESLFSSSPPKKIQSIITSSESVFVSSPPKKTQNIIPSSKSHFSSSPAKRNTAIAKTIPQSNMPYNNKIPSPVVNHSDEHFRESSSKKQVNKERLRDLAYKFIPITDDEENGSSSNVGISIIKYEPKVDLVTKKKARLSGHLIRGIDIQPQLTMGPMENIVIEEHERGEHKNLIQNVSDEKELYLKVSNEVEAASVETDLGEERLPVTPDPDKNNHFEELKEDVLRERVDGWNSEKADAKCNLGSVSEGATPDSFKEDYSSSFEDPSEHEIIEEESLNEDHLDTVVGRLSTIMEETSQRSSGGKPQEDGHSPRQTPHTNDTVDSLPDLSLSAGPLSGNTMDESFDQSVKVVTADADESVLPESDHETKALADDSERSSHIIPSVLPSNVMDCKGHDKTVDGSLETGALTDESSIEITSPDAPTRREVQDESLIQQISPTSPQSPRVICNSDPNETQITLKTEHEDDDKGSLHSEEIGVVDSIISSDSNEVSSPETKENVATEENILANDEEPGSKQNVDILPSHEVELEVGRLSLLEDGNLSRTRTDLEDSNILTVHEASIDLEAGRLSLLENTDPNERNPDPFVYESFPVNETSIDLEVGRLSLLENTDPNERNSDPLVYESLPANEQNLSLEAGKISIFEDTTLSSHIESTPEEELTIVSETIHLSDGEIITSTKLLSEGELALSDTSSSTPNNSSRIAEIPRSGLDVIKTFVTQHAGALAPEKVDGKSEGEVSDSSAIS